MKTRHAPAEATAPVQLPTAATLPSSFPDESMPVGATYFDEARIDRLVAALVTPRNLAIQAREAYLSEHPERRTVYDGLDDCDEQEENGK